MKKVMFAAVLALLVSGAAVAQDFPRAEVFAGYSMLKLGISDSELDERISRLEQEEGPSLSTSASKLMKKGFNGSVAFNVTPAFGIVADLRYNQDNIVDFTAADDFVSVEGNIKLRNLSLMAGPRFTYRGNERVTPFAHALVGLDHRRYSPEATATFTDPEIPEVNADLPSETLNGLGFALGGGLDVNLSESVAIRLIQADYYMTRHEGDSMNNMNLAFGVVFRIGE